VGDAAGVVTGDAVIAAVGDGAAVTATGAAAVRGSLPQATTSIALPVTRASARPRPVMVLVDTAPGYDIAG
jgi:hypothetical protein